MSARRASAPGIAPFGPLPYMVRVFGGEFVMVLALIQVLMMLLSVVRWVIIIQFVLSLLLVFNVINTHNDFVRTLYGALEKMTEPLYRPIRRFMPDFGGIDFSPMVVIIIVMILQQLLGGLYLDVSRGYV